MDYNDGHIDWSEWRNHFFIDVLHGNSAITGSCKHCKGHFNSMTSRRGLAHIHKVEGKGVKICGSIPETIRAKLRPWKFAIQDEDEEDPPVSQAAFASGKNLFFQCSQE